MRHRVAVAVLFTLALALAATGLLASNMGFLVWRTLVATGPGVSLSGTNTLALPYQRDDDLVSAGSLMTDIGFGSVLNVVRYLEPTAGLQVYTGRKGSGPNFPLTAGECYFVRMGVTTDYLVGGSSDPALALPLEGPGPGNPSGTNFIVLPYHSIAGTASQLMADVGFASVVNVQRFLTASDSLQVYTGRKASGPDFPLNPTECYFVRMSAAVLYVPSHY